MAQRITVGGRTYDMNDPEDRDAINSDPNVISGDGNVVNVSNGDDEYLITADTINGGIRFS